VITLGQDKKSFSEAKNGYPKTVEFGLDFVPIRKDKSNFMETIDHYHKGLLFATYLLINSDKEISDDELYYLHKMRVEEGISDEVFADHFLSLLGKDEREIYQIGIDSINRCPDDQKLRIFRRLYQMALSDGVLRVKEVRFILYAIQLTHVDSNTVFRMFDQKSMAA
jgi:hypothetical protein